MFLGKESPVDRNWRGFLFANLHGLATNFFRGEFPKRRATPTKGPYLGGARKGYGYLHLEREGLNSGSLGRWVAGLLFGNVELWHIIFGILGFGD